MDTLLYNLLTGTSAIIAIVGDRIAPYGDPMPGETRDRLIYHQTGGQRDYDSDGQGLARPEYQIDAWSPTAAGASALIATVAKAVSGYKGGDIKMILITHQGDLDSLQPGETATEYGKFIRITMICKET